MEPTEGNLRYAAGTQANVNWEAPRKADIAWLASQGYNKNRLPIRWEMLQPVLFDTNINAATQAIVGVPGAFNAMYQSHIQAVLDAHAAAGTKCWIDLHNYCRYRDFRYQADGSVIGLQKPRDPTIYPYTIAASEAYVRIFATAPGATLRINHYTDLWTRIARLWKDHPGFGGYGLMNEPNLMPAPGGTTATVDGSQDLHIWPVYAQAAINAIRAIDPANPIYLDSNTWSAAFVIDTENPDWPVQGTNIIYSVHMYLDAGSTGQRFDWDAEVAKGYSGAGLGNVPISVDTGWKRLKIAVDWAASKGGLKLALTETGMPLDDPRWQEDFQRLTDYARANNVELYPWNGGAHWPIHNYGINFAPGWHQNRTLEPAMSGVVKKSWGINAATIFDDGPGYALAGTPITITVYARGYLASPVTVNISSNNAGTLSSSSITLAAGANSQATYTFTPATDRVTTLSYTVSGGLNAPPQRKVYSLVDPVAFSATSLADAARALIAKYSACKWEAVDGYTDYEGGAPAQVGQQVRAIADSGYGSSVGNAMEMINWMNTDVAATANMPPPVMRLANNRRATDHAGWSTSGFWCKKTVPTPAVQSNPRNVVPYTCGDPHFVIAAVSAPAGATGVVFQASNSTALHASQLSFSNGVPQASVKDASGATVTLNGPAQAADAPMVMTLTSVPGAQRLRVNQAVVASGASSFSMSAYDQMMIGWGFQSWYPVQGFGGLMYSVITGKGAPSAAELQVMERYLASTAGLASNG
ncbi:MAG TPA: cellulase family glycosylhydrolase [Ramlibacter sp.]|nr:cellulase family glycosylhydrolase [Ramlibacter sp.]